MTTSLHDCVKHRDARRLQELLQDADVNVDVRSAVGVTALHLASFVGFVDGARVLLDHGADPNLGNALQYRPLMVAAREGRLECLRLLIARGAQVAAVDDEGQTALCFAANFGPEPAVIVTLVKSGADVNHVSRGGIYPADAGRSRRHGAQRASSIGAWCTARHG